MDPKDIWTFLLLLGALFVVVVGVELLARRYKLPLELTRKATHILAGVLVALWAFFMPVSYLALLGVLFIAVIGLSRSRGIFRSIHDPERSGIGELWYPVGILLAALLFPEPSVFAYAILILSVSDGLAGLAGKLFGTRKVGFISAPKTYVGSGAFVVSATIIGAAFMPLPIALLAGLYLAAIELLSFRGMDNLILPMAAGVIASLYATY